MQCVKQTAIDVCSSCLDQWLRYCVDQRSKSQSIHNWQEYYFKGFKVNLDRRFQMNLIEPCSSWVLEFNNSVQFKSAMYVDTYIILAKSCNCNANFRCIVIRCWLYVVCLSVICRDASALWQNSFTAKQLRISSDSTMSLKTKFEGGPLDRGLKLGWRWFSIRDIISRKKCEIELKWQLLTDRKSHMGFRLQQKSMTLNDLERQFTALSSVLRVTKRLMGGDAVSRPPRATPSVGRLLSY